MKVRKRPITVTAVQWTGENFDEVAALDPQRVLHSEGSHLLVLTLEGALTGRVGDWIIKGIAGEVYPCAADIFAMTYEFVV